MVEVNEFKYFGSILSKYESMEVEMKERHKVQGREMVGSLGCKINMEIKEGLRNGTVVPTLT